MISEPVARITKVLRLHGDQCTRANADYLAQRVAAELDLTEETRNLPGTEHVGRVCDECYPKVIAWARDQGLLPDERDS